MAPVGKFKPNAFGLHDMTGNVWEWLADCYERSYANVPTDGTALVKDDCDAYSIRGGSWGYDLPDILFDGIGLRVARDLVPEPHVPDWHLRVFEDTTHRVVVLYPASYTTVVGGTDKIFAVSSPYGIPRMDIGLTTDANADVAQLVDAYVASFAFGKGKGGKPSTKGVDRTATVDTTTLPAGVVAEEITLDWHHAESQTALRTLILSVADETRGRITLYLTASPRHDWNDLRRLAHTLRVHQ